jgi:hypothetical protein
MKKFLQLLLAASLIIAFTQTSCKKAPCDAVLPAQKAGVPFKILSQTVETDGDKQCTTAQAEFGPEYESVKNLDPQGGVIFPGAVLNYTSVQNGSYIPIIGNRRPITLSISLSNITGEVSRTVENPSLSSVREAILEILKSKTGGGTAASISWSQKEIYSKEHFRLAVGGNYGNLFFDIDANYSYSSTEVLGRFLFEFTQEYYSIDMNPPKPGMEHFFGGETDCSQVGGESPVYVSSVKYGRKVFLLVESNEFGYSHMASIKGSFDAFFSSGGISVDATLSKLMNQKSIKAVIIGGPAADAVKTVNNVESLKEYLLNGANFNENSPAVPLSYTLRFVDDNSIAKLVLYDKFTIRDCQIIPPITEWFQPASISELKLNHIGGDREFDGNGPKVTISCNLDIRNNSKEVWAKVTVDAIETKSDYTHGNRVYEVRLWTCPAGRKISTISSEKSFSFSYVDDDTANEIFDFPVSKVVSFLEIKGDTGGNDLAVGTLEEEAHLHLLKFNKVSVLTVPQ